LAANAELIEGAHADSIMYVFDESKAISQATFDAAEGAFSELDDVRWMNRTVSTRPLQPAMRWPRDVSGGGEPSACPTACRIPLGGQSTIKPNRSTLRPVCPIAVARPAGPSCVCSASVSASRRSLGRAASLLLSQWPDLLKRRPTEVIGYFNGLVARKGAAAGIPTPFNNAVTDMFIRLERGELTQDVSNLGLLAATISSPATDPR
jgi:hypothetical protein